MARHVEFGLDHAEHAPVLAHNKRRPLARQWADSLDAEEPCYGSVWIRQQGKTKVVLFIEGFLPIHRIGADPYALGTEFREFGSQITKVTALDRSTRGHRLRVEKEHHRPVRDQLA